MRKFINLAAAAAFSLAALPLSAEAFPVTHAPVAAADVGVTLVAGGCGLGLHRGPFGGCRPNGGVIVGRPMVRVYRPICRMVLLPLPHRVCR